MNSLLRHPRSLNEIHRAAAIWGEEPSPRRRAKRPAPSTKSLVMSARGCLAFIAAHHAACRSPALPLSTLSHPSSLSTSQPSLSTPSGSLLPLLAPLLACPVPLSSTLLHVRDTGTAGAGDTAAGTAGAGAACPWLSPPDSGAGGESSRVWRHRLRGGSRCMAPDEPTIAGGKGHKAAPGGWLESAAVGVTPPHPTPMLDNHMVNALALAQALTVALGLCLSVVFMWYVANFCVAAMVAVPQDAGAPATVDVEAQDCVVVTSPDGTVGLGFRHPRARTRPPAPRDDSLPASP